MPTLILIRVRTDFLEHLLVMTRGGPILSSLPCDSRSPTVSPGVERAHPSPTREHLHCSVVLLSLSILGAYGARMRDGCLPDTGPSIYSGFKASVMRLWYGGNQQQAVLIVRMLSCRKPSSPILVRRSYTIFISDRCNHAILCVISLGGCLSSSGPDAIP